MTSRFLSDLDEQAKTADCVLDVNREETGPAGDTGDAAGRNARPRASDIVVGLALDTGIDLFHGAGADGDAYVTLNVKGHTENYVLTGRRIRRWLGHLYYQQTGSTPPTQAMEDALAVLQGRALYDGPEHDVSLRIAQHEGAIYIDLGDADWKAVRVDAYGWDIVVPPVKFVRSRGMLPMPVPVRGGSLDEWRELVNVPDDDQWVLLTTSVTTMFRPGYPFVILLIQGEQGSAKSTLCRQIKALVDPNVAPLRAEPREIRDLVIAGKNGWLQSFDNLSHISPWLSDALCRLSTGGGSATRELYENDSEVLLNVMRPTLINGIDEVSTRSDLLDRMVTLSLPTLDRYQSEAAIQAAFESRRPRILGAFLDAVSCGMGNLKDTDIERPPRMADFALFGAAAAPALGFSGDHFVEVYRANRQTSSNVALEASPIVPALLEIMESQSKWTGVSRQLLADLELRTEDQHRKQRGWPKTARQLTSTLKRITPNLRANKLLVSFGKHTRDGIPIQLSWMDMRETSSPTSPTSPGPSNDAAPCDERDDGDDGTVDGQNTPHTVGQHYPVQHHAPETQHLQAIRGPQPEVIVNEK